MFIPPRSMPNVSLSKCRRRAPNCQAKVFTVCSDFDAFFKASSWLSKSYCFPANTSFHGKLVSCSQARPYLENFDQSNPLPPFFFHLRSTAALGASPPGMMCGSGWCWARASVEQVRVTSQWSLRTVSLPEVSMLWSTSQFCTHEVVLAATSST